MTRIRVLGLMVGIAAVAASCGGESEKPCEEDGTGRVSLSNGYATQIELFFNGISYGAVNPGDSGSVDLTSGSYTMEMIFVGGGVACSATTVNVSECSKQAFECAP